MISLTLAELGLGRHHVRAIGNSSVKRAELSQQPARSHLFEGTSRALSGAGLLTCQGKIERFTIRSCIRRDQSPHRFQHEERELPYSAQHSSDVLRDTGKNAGEVLLFWCLLNTRSPSSADVEVPGMLGSPAAWGRLLFRLSAEGLGLVAF